MPNDEPITVLVVEDSKVAQMLLVHLLNSDSRVKVIGTAKTGQEALDFLHDRLPNVILMDIEMPGMDGFEATRRIMETQPVPIVICSGQRGRDDTTMFRLMEVGAVAFVEKPVGREHPNFAAMSAHLVETIKLMSEVKVVRRWPRTRGVAGASELFPSRWVKQSPPRVEMIGIGASTGGPPVLQTILSSLPKDFSVPILIVQHIAPGFLPGLVEWLNQTTGFKVQIAAYGIRALPGHVYLAPDDCHMTARPSGGILLSREEKENGLRPSVARLFRSLAKNYGAKAIGVLLTGMGKDGAQELKLMKEQGALTIAQDRETSIVHGMPGEAISLGGATFVLPADKIASALLTQVGRQPI